MHDAMDGALVTDFISPPASRRRFVQGLALASGAAAIGVPLWTRAEGVASGPAALSGDSFDLTIGERPINITGRRRIATAVNGSVPAPTLRLREGSAVTIKVTNRLAEPTSIHWHGFRLPNDMDGVPGLTFKGIMPGETFTYRFPIVQSGTYWYHSHSGMQEQTGLYGAVIMEPKEAAPYAFDREYVIVLSDWTDEDPMAVIANLKQQGDYYNFHQRTLGTFLDDAQRKGFEGDLGGLVDVGPDADEPDRHHGRDRGDLHLPHQRPAAGGQLDGPLPARRAGAAALRQQRGDVDLRRAHSGPAADRRRRRRQRCRSR